MKTLCFVLALVVAGCASAAPGDGHVPSTGRYRYTAEYRAPDGAVVDRFTGTLEITRATPRRITGIWHVPGFQPDLQIGARHGDAYVANADVTVGPSRTGGTFQQRIRRVGEATEILCEAEFITGVAQDVVTYPATCTLSYVGA